MAVNLSQQDIDYIARVVETEVPQSVKRRDPAQYDAMVKAVTDTVLNRMASDQYPDTAVGVLNQNRQFTKITGPSRINPYGSVERTPEAPASVKSLVTNHIADRAQGAPSIVGGALSYANPNFSDRSNIRGWINPMIEAGAQRFGVGRNVHYHGNAPGQRDVGPFEVRAEGIPSGRIPTPEPRPGTGQADSATGIMAALDPVPAIPVERGLLADVTPARAPFDMERFGPIPSTENFDTARFGPREAPVRDFDTARFGTGTTNRQGYTDLREGLLASNAQMAAPSGLISEAVAAAPRQAMDARMLADQYRQYGMGQGAMQQAMAGRNLAMDVADARTSRGLLPVEPAAVPGYVEPMVTKQTPQVAAPAITPVAQSAFTPQQQAARDTFGEPFGVPMSFDMTQADAQRMERALRTREIIGGILGGIGGGMLLGGPGAVIGGFAGRQAGRRTYYPTAPQRPANLGEAKGYSYSDLGSEGREAYRESEQFRDAVNSGRGGLW